MHILEGNAYRKERQEDGLRESPNKWTLEQSPFLRGTLGSRRNKLKGKGKAAFCDTKYTQCFREGAEQGKRQGTSS